MNVMKNMKFLIFNNKKEINKNRKYVWNNVNIIINGLMDGFIVLMNVLVNLQMMENVLMLKKLYGR